MTIKKARETIRQAFEDDENFKLSYIANILGNKYETITR